MGVNNLPYRTRNKSELTIEIIIGILGLVILLMMVTGGIIR
jgi:hypothetical protein